MATTLDQPLYHAFLGSLAADAVSMPVHWYYDTAALDRDYSTISTYQPTPPALPSSND